MWALGLVLKLSRLVDMDEHSDLRCRGWFVLHYRWLGRATTDALQVSISSSAASSSLAWVFQNWRLQRIQFQADHDNPITRRCIYQLTTSHLGPGHPRLKYQPSGLLIASRDLQRLAPNSGRQRL